MVVEEVSEEEFQAFKQSFLQECEQSSRLRHPNIVLSFFLYRLYSEPALKVYSNMCCSLRIT